jgi:hypothetical protein
MDFGIIEKLPAKFLVSKIEIIAPIVTEMMIVFVLNLILKNKHNNNKWLVPETNKPPIPKNDKNFVETRNYW